MSNSTRFVDGQVYRYDQIRERTWGPDSPPDSLWEYVAAEHGFAPARPSDPLVDGQEASRAVAALPGGGPVVSRDRQAGGGGVRQCAEGGERRRARVRHSTERALTDLAGELGR